MRGVALAAITALRRVLDSIGRMSVNEGIDFSQVMNFRRLSAAAAAEDVTMARPVRKQFKSANEGTVPVALPSPMTKRC